MPLPTATGSRFDTNYVENTMGAAPVRTSRASLGRLKYRYRDVDLEAATRSLCAFLRSNGSRTNNIDKFRVAERAIYPLFGSAGKDQATSSDGGIIPGTLEAAIYFWIAACDDSPAVIAVSATTDRKENFVRALYEAQRGNNNGDRGVAGAVQQNSARINFNDDGSTTDSQICMVGTLNKLCELFVGSHPDVELIAELNSRVLYLAKGFVADKCLELGFTLEQLAEGTVDLSVLTQEAVTAIKNKVIDSLGGLYLASNNLGLVGAPELRYLNETLSPAVIEYLDFSVERNAGDPTAVTPAEVQSLIRDANEQLARASIILHADPNAPAREFPYQRASAIVKDLLPAPANTTQHIWENNLGTRAPMRGLRDLHAWNHTNLEADYTRYYARREAERVVAMEPQPITATPDQCAKTREDRHQARGMRPKT